MILIEAGIAGTPIIASRTGGIPEIVEHKKSGLLFEQGDVQGLADSILFVIDHPERARQMAAEANRHIQRYLNDDRYFQSFINIYEELLQSDT